MSAAARQGGYDYPGLTFSLRPVHAQCTIIPGAWPDRFLGIFKHIELHLLLETANYISWPSSQENCAYYPNPRGSIFLKGQTLWGSDLSAQAGRSYSLRNEITLIT